MLLARGTLLLLLAVALPPMPAVAARLVCRCIQRCELSGSRLSRALSMGRALATLRWLSWRRVAFLLLRRRRLYPYWLTLLDRVFRSGARGCTADSWFWFCCAPAAQNAVHDAAALAAGVTSRRRCGRVGLAALVFSPQASRCSLRFFEASTSRTTCAGAASLRDFRFPRFMPAVVLTQDGTLEV